MTTRVKKKSKIKDLLKELKYKIQNINEKDNSIKIYDYKKYKRLIDL